MAKPMQKVGKHPNPTPMRVLAGMVHAGEYASLLGLAHSDATQHRDGHLGGKLSLHGCDPTLLSA